MIHPFGRYCSKCGAEPGESCRTAAGKRYPRLHQARHIDSTPEYVQKATRFECWKTGWKAGTSGVKTAQAHELAVAYLAPADYRDGWRAGAEAADEAQEQARQRIMG